MSARLFSPNLTVAQTLSKSKETSQIFIRHHTACVGCALAHFCTLKDVAKTYGLSLDDFLRDLQSAAQTHYPTFTGAQNEKHV